MQCIAIVMVFSTDADSQWFGVDIGGSLVKCVYFECPGANGSSQEESLGIAEMRGFLKSNRTYGSSGKGEDGALLFFTFGVYSLKMGGFCSGAIVRFQLVDSTLFYSLSPLSLPSLSPLSLPPGVRDDHLEMHSQEFGGQRGTLHFIKFATSRMSGFMDMVQEYNLTEFSKVVCATGGGAFKFENDFREVCTENFKILLFITAIIILIVIMMMINCM